MLATSPGLEVPHSMEEALLIATCVRRHPKHLATVPVMLWMLCFRSSIIDHTATVTTVVEEALSASCWFGRLVHDVLKLRAGSIEMREFIS